MLNIQNYSKARENMLRYFEIIPQTEGQKKFIQELHDLIQFADSSLIEYEVHISVLKKKNSDEQIMYLKNLVSLYKRLLIVYGIEPSLISELDKY
jgi:hypothetical protein